ncbi:hypothetical protein Pmani_026399 [Petrolisthes manimaculis]|uniref:ethanolamine kinase n=1 Tax=Petrolisthes manimaculis TaxID=1843537 RepID=A0AAE1P3H2_9EUCA|nr:hypothetical protein Pmani_026399 [Petrolisthes manimaculis]
MGLSRLGNTDSTTTTTTLHQLSDGPSIPTAATPGTVHCLYPINWWERKLKMILELSVDASNVDNLKNGARKIISHVRPEWKQDELQYKVYTDGITNQLIGVWYNDRNSQLLIRVYGQMTEKFIDRGVEKNNFEILHKAGCGPELHAVFENGLCYGYIVGEPVTTDQIIQVPIWECVAKEMAKFHRIQVENKGHPILFPKIRRFFSLMPDKFSDPEKQKRLEKSGYTKESLQKEVEVLADKLESLKCPVVFSHNDLLLGNVIWNNNQRTVNFIDYEYGGPNFQPFDIANHFNEFAGVDEVDYNRYPNKAFQYKWLRTYLAGYTNKTQEDVLEEEVEKWYVWVNKFALSSHLFWGSWALVQAEFSTIDFDFLGYGIIRLNEHFAKKDEYLGLKVSC